MVQGTVGQQYSKAAQQFGVHISPSVLDTSYKKVWHAQWREHPNYGSTTGMSQKQWWRQFVVSVFMDARYDGEPHTLHEMSSKLHQDFMDGNLWEMLPGTHHMLSSLRDHGIELAVVSNFERLSVTLERYGLKDYFSFLMTSVECGYDKPDPRIFQAALGTAGMVPRHVCHVGDDIKNDYLAARFVGMDAFLLGDPEKIPKSVDRSHIISKLPELVDIVDRDMERNMA